MDERERVCDCGSNVRWDDVNWIIKWTLKNAKYLDHDETYLIEKETDNCLLAFRQQGLPKTPTPSQSKTAWVEAIING